MKRYLMCGVLFVSLFFACSVLGQTESEMGADLDWQRAAMLRFLMVGQESFKGVGEIMTGQEGEGSGKKSLFVGVLMSAVLPGAGEFYAGSWLKGAIFLGAEVALWIGYWKFSDNGREWEILFHAYADAHWDEDQWQEWMDEHPDFADTTHTLPDEKNQQYYEMIGKYDQFKAGWDDYYDGDSAMTPNRDYYEGLRYNSNLQFKRASYCAMVSLGNRVLSVFDTAWTIRKFNRRVEGKVRMTLKKGGVDWVPCLTLCVNW